MSIDAVWRLRYNYFRFLKTNVRHIGNLLSVSISTICQKSAHYSASGYIELCPNRSIHCGNMTLYPFLKMAAATAEYYFQFRICWCHCLQKVKVSQQTKFRRYISIGGWDITTSGFDIQTAAILEFYFWFRSRPVRPICMLFSIRLPNFVQMVAPTVEIWRHIHFSTWRP